MCLSVNIMPSGKLCTRCGLCCDGTLFAWVPTNPSDNGKNLNAPSLFDLGDINGGKIFHPCQHHLNRMCEIYEQRPETCVQYKCKLLRQYEKGKISFDQAMAIIVNTTRHVDRIKSQLCYIESASKVNLMSLYSAWEKTQNDAGSIEWKKRNIVFILHFLTLQRRLERYFRNKKKAESIDSAF